MLGHMPVHDRRQRGRVRRSFLNHLHALDARSLVPLIVALGTIARVPQLTHSLAEQYAFRQTQTAWVVREYAAHGINLLHTPLPVFGPHSQVPFEFPLFQGLATCWTYIGLSPATASRLTGLMSFEATVALLAVLLLRWGLRRESVLAALLMEFTSFGLEWGASSLIDFFSVALALVMVLGLDAYWRARPIPRVWLACGVVAAWLVYLVKVTTAAPWSLLLLASAANRVRREGLRGSAARLGLALAGGPGVGVLLLALWTRYCDQIKDHSRYTEWLDSTHLMSWNFGTLAQRLAWQNYDLVLHRMHDTITGPLAVAIPLAFLALLQTPSETRIHLMGILAVVIASPGIFFNLYVHHDYYQICIFPALAALLAGGICRLFEILPLLHGSRRMWAPPLAAALTASTWVTQIGRMDVYTFLHAASVPVASAHIRDATQPSDRILATGCDWDPELFFYAHRSGLMIRNEWRTRTLAPGELRGYQYLFECPGSYDARRILHRGTTLIPTRYTNLLKIQQRL